MSLDIVGDASDRLVEMADALRGGHGQIALVYVFGHGLCAQVMVGRRKVGPLVIPTDGQTLGEVLAMLGDLVTRDPDDSHVR